MINEKSPLHHRRAFLIAFILALVALVSLSGGGLATANPQTGHGPATARLGHGAKPTIVLVHGDWADASSWSAVIERLQARGYTVVAPPNPLRGPSEDSPYLASYLETISGPIVLVGHSYGGFVITNAATGNSNVKALVYIDAFIPDLNQRLVDLTAGSGSCLDPNSAVNAVPFNGGVDLYLRIEPNPPYTGFAQCFANGVSPREAAMLAAVQRPATLNQLFEPSGPPAWETIPSWSLIGTEDHAVPPTLQEAMSTNAGARISTVHAGHLSLITRPDAVTRIILSAIDATT
jgi:pimeloyl-ACP methyl ester carboxylesterase